MVALSHRSDRESVYLAGKMEKHKIPAISKGTLQKMTPALQRSFTDELRFGLPFRINAERVHRHRP